MTQKLIRHIFPIYVALLSPAHIRETDGQEAPSARYVSESEVTFEALKLPNLVTCRLEPTGKRISVRVLGIDRVNLDREGVGRLGKLIKARSGKVKLYRVEGGAIAGDFWLDSRADRRVQFRLSVLFVRARMAVPRYELTSLDPLLKKAWEESSSQALRELGRQLGSDKARRKPSPQPTP